MSLRIGVIGCGAMARRFHLPCLQYCQRLYNDLRVRWCCDRLADRAAAAAKMFPTARAVQNWQAALDAQPVDACLVLVDVAAMFDVVRELLAQPVAVLLEKPPGANLQQARQLCALAAESAAPTQVGFNRRHNRYLAAALDHIGGRDRVQAVSYEMFRVARREPTFLAYTMIHAIDALRHVAGEPQAWQAVAGHDPCRWSLSIQFAGGAIAALAVYPDVGLKTERCTLHSVGRSATACGLQNGTADGLGRAELYEASELIKQVGPDPSLPAELAEAAGAGFLDQMRHFLTSLRTGQSPYPSLAETLGTMEWTDRILSRLSMSWPG